MIVWVASLEDTTVTNALDRAWLTAVVFAFAACGGTPTGSECPTTDPPTWESFGSAFFATYCNGCHSYSTEIAVRGEASQIDGESAAGPNASNTDMPPGGATAPTEAERTTLGQFLACEAAQ